MTKLTVCSMGYVVFLIFAGAAICVQAQTFTTLVTFNGPNGATPHYGSLIQGQDGKLYGTTEGGGTYFSGSVFSMTSSGEVTTIYDFCSKVDCADGETPYGGLVLGTDGNFYGTTRAGGTSICCGTVFKLTADGILTTLYNFCSEPNCNDGQWPYAALVQGIDGSFYGTTFIGGIYGYGTIFKITSSGDFLVLHNFDDGDGQRPTSTMIQATDGNFYGTTSEGGDGGGGTVFKITPAGLLTTVHYLGGQYGNPIGGIIQGADGALYGTAAGGIDGGIVFRLTLGGTLSVLLFDGSDGANPWGGVIQATDGNFYGTTLFGGGPACGGDGCGVVFQATRHGTLTSLYSFCSQPDCTDGENPYSGLLQATSGTLYGTTEAGGANNEGTVFSLSMGLGPFVSFVRPAGKVGQTGPILGQGFTGTTSVMLNGVPANFTVVSDTYIRATVPPGATTGYVTVTTPSGVLKSNVPFHVIH